jgi:histidyl-tRNA synthetase
VLRPDSTIAAARLYAEQPGEAAMKLFYSQDVFRFTDDDAPRHEWQCGVELIGERGVMADVELILLALEVLETVLDERPQVRVSHAALARTVLAAAGLAAEEQAAAYDRLLDGDLSVIAEIEARLPQLNSPLHLLFDVEGAGSAYIANVGAALGPAIPALAAALSELGEVVQTLERVGVTPVVQAALARSFEYYSGTVFRIDAGGHRVCAGGRYDDLVALVGGSPAPASGFALYLSPIAELLPGGSGVTGPVVVEAVDPMTALEIARELQRRGLTASTVGGSSGRRVVVAQDGGFAVDTRAGRSAAATIDDVVRLLGSGE